MKVSRLLEGYFKDDSRSRLHEAGLTNALPISPKKSEWKASGDVLLRTFKFKDRSHLKDFAIFLLELEEESSNDLIVTIKSSNVSVSKPMDAYENEELLEDLDDAYEEITGG